MAEPKKIIISFRTGRLANRLILFAQFIALAEERGWQVSNVNFHSYAEFFKNPRRDIYCRYPVAKKRSWLDLIPGLAPAIRKTRIFSNLIRYAGLHLHQIPFLKKSAVLLREKADWEVMDLDGENFANQTRAAKIIFVHGWKFRATNLVERHAQKIRDYFEPLDKFENAAREIVGTLRREADIVVGVHIRQGDYRHWRNGKFFFEIDRYASWMREIAGQFPGRPVAFFVCSDEVRVAEEFPGLKVAFGSSPIVDLIALSKCDFIVGPVSSFSQWASFYGAKPLLHFQSADHIPDLKTASISDLNLK
jgi:hypothetical protein